MSAWTLFVYVVGVVCAGLLMLALGWAAIERGRVHREWARQRALRQKVGESIDWCLAMAAAAGCA